MTATVRLCQKMPILVSKEAHTAVVQVSERRPEVDDNDGAKRRSGSSRVGDVVADINRGGGLRDPANVLVQVPLPACALQIRQKRPAAGAKRPAH